MRITKDWTVALLDPFLLPELAALCHSYAESALLGLLPTVPHWVRCKDALIVESRAVQTHGRPTPYVHWPRLTERPSLPPMQHEYSFQPHVNVRNLAVRSTVTPTQVVLLVGASVVWSTVIGTANQWVLCERFTGYNLLLLSTCHYNSALLYATNPVEITYEQVDTVSEQPTLYWDYVLQQTSDSRGSAIDLIYVQGFCCVSSCDYETLCRFVQQKTDRHLKVEVDDHVAAIIRKCYDRDPPCFESVEEWWTSHK